MKKYLVVFVLSCVLVAALAVRWGLGRHAEVRRLKRNQYALCDSLHRYRTRLGEEAASVAVLRLRCDELLRLRADDARRLRDMGIRIRRLESAAATAVKMQTDVRAAVRDTVVPCIADGMPEPFQKPLPEPFQKPLSDSFAMPQPAETLRIFNWSDGWVTVEGVECRDSVFCRVTSVDTLRQYVHRVPHRFLFFRWGTRAVRQEIVSSNPHTHIVWAEYIEIERRKRNAKRR